MLLQTARQEITGLNAANEKLEADLADGQKSWSFSPSTPFAGHCLSSFSLVWLLLLLELDMGKMENMKLKAALQVKKNFLG